MSSNTEYPPLPVALRAIAAWLESHPEFHADAVDAFDCVGHSLIVRMYGVADAEQLGDLARRLGGRWIKEMPDQSTLFKLRQEIAPGIWAELVANREAVCERVVVATEEREVVTPVAWKTGIEVVEVAEWRCAPLLGREAAES